MADKVLDETSTAAIEIDKGDLVFCAVPQVHLLEPFLSASYGAIRSADATLLIHNGDVLPELDLYVDLLSAFRYVYSVNVTPPMADRGVRALPIGIENLHHARNGLTSYFSTLATRRDLKPILQRGIEVLASFREETNPAARSELKTIAVQMGATWVEPTLHPEAYFEMVRESQFVLSPPGNGLDCHRTWEAIYLGAIPVVLEETLPLQVTDSLPIAVVSSWSDFLAQKPVERRQLLARLQMRSVSRAYMPAWCGELVSDPRP
jgi:hypothetical protein